MLLCCLILMGCKASDFRQPEEPFQLRQSRSTNAVVTYTIADGQLMNLYPLEEGFLCSVLQDDTVRLVRFTSDLQPVLSCSTALSEEDAREGIQILPHAIACCSPRENCIILYDVNLKERGRISLPEGSVGIPVLSENGCLLYYMTEQALYELNLSTGIPRIIKAWQTPPLCISCLMMDDTVLLYRESDGSVFLSCEDGQTLLHTNQPVHSCFPGKTFCFASYLEPEDIISFGQDFAGLQQLSPPSGNRLLAYLPTRDMALTCRESREYSILDSYDLSSGTRIASVRLDRLRNFSDFCPCKDGTVLFLGWDESLKQTVLLRWDMQQSSVTDSNIYIGPYASPETPDCNGLIKCMLTAEQLLGRHGITVKIWEDAASASPIGYQFTPEYRAPVLQAALLRLDQALARIPNIILKKTGTIQLVQQIQASPGYNMPDGEDSLHFWNSAGGNIALTATANLEHNLYHQLGHLIDTQVVNTCNAFDRWESPDSPVEDRARILEYAITDGNELFFQTEPMQEKLRMLCVGIRKAFDLSKSPENYIWEQYLWNSISYKSTKESDQ